MTDKEFVCAYRHCLHPGEKVKASESVDVGRSHYHWDCAALKQKLKDCVDTYMGYIDDKSQYPMVFRIINTLVFKDEIDVDFILKNIETSKQFYKNKPPYVLYGLRKLWWEM